VNYLYLLACFSIFAIAFNGTIGTAATTGRLRAFSQIVEKFAADIENRQTDNENNDEGIHFCSFLSRSFQILKGDQISNIF
jgi:hypothetical protein